MKKDITKIIRKIASFLRNHISRKHEGFPYYMLIFIAFLVFVGCINIFVELTDEVLENSAKTFDNRITDYVLSFRTESLTDFFIVITNMGKFYAYVIMTTLVSIYLFRKFRNWKFILQLLAITILSALSNVVLKRVFDRERPGIEHLVPVETLSYPSGHAMSAMAFYGFLMYLAFHIKMVHWLRWLICIVFAAFIFLVGLSRVYLGVHYPSDVVGGFAAGLIWVAFCVVLFTVVVLFQKKKARKNPDQDEKELEN